MRELEKVFYGLVLGLMAFGDCLEDLCFVFLCFMGTERYLLSTPTTHISVGGERKVYQRHKDIRLMVIMGTKLAPASYLKNLNVCFTTGL